MLFTVTLRLGTKVFRFSYAKDIVPLYSIPIDAKYGIETDSGYS